jgi:hypothetical protein
MDIVLVVVLYLSNAIPPVAHAERYVYSDMSQCIEAAENLKYSLMQSAPNSDSRVNVQCIVMPKEV